MSEGKKIILERIQKALKEVPADETPEDIAVPRSYRREGNLGKEQRVALFAERVGEYKATVERLKKEELPEAIAEACRREEIGRLVVPPEIPPEWIPDFVAPRPDSHHAPFSHQQLDIADGVLTICAAAVAETGTIILDGGEGQGRRAITLVPDYHLCVVHEDQIVELVAEGFEQFEQTVRMEGAPITFISGPSATSDIELNRVEGVHGPRRLEVLIVEG
jgi:L-lactate dehydrogenase complex protein LldG